MKRPPPRRPAYAPVVETTSKRPRPRGRDVTRDPAEARHDRALPAGEALLAAQTGAILMSERHGRDPPHRRGAGVADRPGGDERARGGVRAGEAQLEADQQLRVAR